MNQKQRLLKDIGIVDFILVELTLFLDTHPEDCKALEYYRHYNNIKKQLQREFSQKYYPLTTADVDCDNEWTWGMAPNPWEGVC